MSAMPTSASMRPVSRDKADTLLLLATCVLVLAPHAGHLPAWIIAACSALLLWRGWITFRGNRMPQRWLLLPIAVIAMAGVYWNYRTIFGREAGVSMLVLLLAFKLLEMHAKRDLFVVLFLSFFLVLAAFFYSQGIGTALMTVAAVIAILTTQLSFQYTGVVPPLKQRLRFGAWILLLAAPLTLALFLLFPRIQGPLWGLPGDAHAGRTGLSETMAPGNIASLAQSDEIAFRAKFLDAPPAKAKLYWRGPVLSVFDGRTWTAENSHARRRISIVRRGAPVRYQVTLEPSGKRWLFALEMPQAVPTLAGNPTGIGPDLELLAQTPITERVRYDAASFVDFDLQPNEAAFVLRQALMLPQGFNPRTLDFAARLSNQSGSDAERIDAVLRYFHEQNFRYTLQPPALGRNAVDEFLFDTQAGFCEHYSGAFVVLMRAMGIPARVVTGYQGGEINPADGFMAVRQSDAHAWAEVWLRDRGWVRVDPTAVVAPERIETNLAGAVPQRMFGGLFTLDALGGPGGSWLAGLRTLRNQWDALANTWNQWVLNYTPERQQSLIQSLGFEKADWQTLIALMTATMVAIMAAIALPLLANRRKTNPVEAVYQSLCRHMARRGCPRLPHEGPRAYGERLAAAGSPLAPAQKTAALRFLRLYESARYGAPGRESSHALASQLKSLFLECR